MNSADSESLARRLLAAGYVEDTLERADVAILNTCVVRQASEDRVYSKLHELKEWKTADRTIAVTGCIVAKESENLTRRFPHLDAVVPIGDYEDFVANLEARYDYSQGEALPHAGRTGVSHYVRVIQGCDQTARSASSRASGVERSTCPSKPSWPSVARRSWKERRRSSCSVRTSTTITTRMVRVDLPHWFARSSGFQV